MIQKGKLVPMLILIGILFLGLVGCVDHQARYEDPPWLGGSSIETLEKAGKYNIYLELMKVSGYEEPVSKQLFSLFVPSDSAFQAYFDKIGIDSVGQLTKKEAERLFSLHLVQNPRNRYYLIYEYAWAEEQGPDGEYAALFFRKATNSTEIPYKEPVRYYEQFQGDTLEIYTTNKEVPLWSYDFFEDYFGALDGSDYLFMYPNSQWSGKTNAMNWHNAMVLPSPVDPDEVEVRTSSGFIFYLDQVVEPMPNVEKYLFDNQDKFGYFYDLYQRFARYNPGVFNENGENIIRYRKSYAEVMDLALEYGPNTSPVNHMKDLFTCFIPSNDVLESYFNDEILATYGTIDDVPSITLYYILQAQLSRSVGLISKLEKSYFNSFGDATEISRDDIESAYVCSNGIVYQTNRVLVPNALSTVPSKLFFDANYSIMLYAFNQSQMLPTVTALDQKVTLFAPSNETLEANRFRYNETLAMMEYQDWKLKWNPIQDAHLLEFVTDHVYFGELPEDFYDGTGEGFLKMASGNYVHYADGKIAGPANEFVRETVGVADITESRNGMLLEADNMIKGRHTLGKEIWRDPNVSTFAKLLKKAGALTERYVDAVTRDTIPYLKFKFSAETWTAFVPSNEAMEMNVEYYDTMSTGVLKEWLYLHFVKNTVTFDDGNPDGAGTFSTQMAAPESVDGPLFRQVTINNEYHNMTVTDPSGQVITVDHEDANNLANKAVSHTINSILKY